MNASEAQDARSADSLLRAISESAPQLIWVSRPDGVVQFWNGRLRDYTGCAPDAEHGIDWSLVLHPDDAPRAAAELAEAMREERTFELEYRLRRHDGAYRWFLARAEPARDESGAIAHWVGTATDIDDHKRAEDATAMLLDATALIAGYRELDAVLPAVADIAVRRFARTCSVYRRMRDGTIVLQALSARDERLAALSREISRMYPPHPQGVLAGAIARNEPVLVARADEPALAALAHDVRHLDRVRRLELSSMVIAPLTVRGDALGAVLFTRHEEDRPFDEGDVATAQILAHRLAGAVDEAATRESERRLAETFQASALPRRLPSLPGIDISAIYQAAEVGMNVGGDWYDAFELSPWRLVVSIGDVAGKGVDAAATMSLIRHGIRFAAHRGQDPADILGVVDIALRAESPELTATAFVAVVDIRESRVRYASAGHPPAALRLPTGAVRLLAPDPAPPLGTWLEGMRPRVDATPLVYGSLLVLYTDGLTEVDRDPIAGEKRLIAALHDDASFASTNPARWVRDIVIGSRPVRDDVAVLTLAYGRRSGWHFEAPDALRAQPARASFESWLADEAEGDAFAAVLIFGELVGNVVRHAPGPIELRAEWRNDELVLHVLDTGGGGFDPARGLPDDSSEGGRGLYIIRTLARGIAVSRNARGSRVSVRLPVARRPFTER